MKLSASQEIAQTIAAYNLIAKAYSQSWSGDPIMQDRIDRLLSFAGKAPAILDLGCGTGRDVQYMRELGCRVFGIDLSIKMLSEASAIFPGLPFALMDMRRLGFPSACFDGVWSTASILHIPKNQVDLVFLEISRVLKQGGVLFVSLQQGEGETVVGDGRYYAYYRGEEFEALLRRHGYQLLCFETNDSTKNTFHQPIVIHWMSYWARRMIGDR